VAKDSRPRDDRKYSRVYHEAVDDSKFRDVWGDDACLALWVRLLVMADEAWPASAALPRSVKKRPLGVLAGVRLVLLHPDGDHYRIRGLDAERARRSQLAAHAAQSRWDADSNADRIADGNAVSMPRQDETRKRLDEGVDVGRARDPERPWLVREEGR
jgi:hypothetical protein